MKSYDLSLEKLIDVDCVGEKKVSIILLRFSTKFSALEFS